MHAATLNSPQSLPNNGERDHGARTFNATADEAAHAGRGRRGARGGRRSGDGITASPASSSQADHLRAIETTRLQALVDADTTTARKLTVPDFQLINPAGAPLSRDEFLGGVDAGVIDFLVLEPSSPIAVRLSGDSATLRYQTTFDLVVGGTHLTHEAWTTALYERRDGRWQIVWEQSTAIPNNLDLFLESIKPVS